MKRTVYTKERFRFFVPAEYADMVRRRGNRRKRPAKKPKEETGG